jgi:DNA-directed RNA polymerase subunit RPC12/RpoP
MVTLVYICNRCKGETESRTFEIEYKDISAAESARSPRCPKCGSKAVKRFFGHNIFCPAKSNKNQLPDRFVPMESQHKKAVVSLGMRIEEGEKEIFEKTIGELIGGEQIEKIDNPEIDIPEEKLGLKKGTLDRALFDIRQKHMIEELAGGKKISGFYLPITGDACN